MRRVLSIVALAAVAMSTAACDQIPAWRVMQGRARGQAALAEAEGSRQALIVEAKAKREAAEEQAKAAVIQAQGVAQANKIMSESLGGPEGYLRFKYIEMLQDSDGHNRETIYVPTEAAMPVLEAGRLVGRAPAPPVRSGP